MKNLVLATAIVSVLALAPAAQATPTIFFGEDTATAGTGLGPVSQAARDSFLSGLIGVGNEDFESFAVGTTAPVLSFPGSSGGLTATLTGDTCVDDTSSAGCGVSNPGRFPTSGDQFWETDSSGSFVVTFDTPVNAFGFNATDVGDFDNQLVVRLTDTEGVVTDHVVDHTLGLPNEANSTLFWGFIDPDVAYVSAAFLNEGFGGDVFAFDDMVVGDREQIANPVPEPATLALFGAGLASLAARRRRS